MIGQEHLINELTGAEMNCPAVMDDDPDGWLAKYDAWSLICALQANYVPPSERIVDWMPNTDYPTDPLFSYFGGMRTVFEDPGKHEVVNGGIGYFRQVETRRGVDYWPFNATEGIVLPLASGIGLWRTGVVVSGNHVINIDVPVVNDHMAPLVNNYVLRGRTRSFLDQIMDAESRLATITAFGYAVSANAHQDEGCYVGDTTEESINWPESNWVTGGKLHTLTLRRHLASLVAEDRFNRSSLRKRPKTIRFIEEEAEWRDPPDWYLAGSELVLTGEVNPIAWREALRAFIPRPLSINMLDFSAQLALRKVDSLRVNESNQAILNMITAGLGLFESLIGELNRSTGSAGEEQELVRKVGKLSVARTLLDLLAVFEINTREYDGNRD